LGDLTAGKYRVILGQALAEELGAKVGDRVVLLVALGDVTPVGVIPRMRAFEVTGILSIGMYEYDRRIAHRRHAGCRQAVAHGRRRARASV
jgi:lipoprotein-releasing system permease protein